MGGEHTLVKIVAEIGCNHKGDLSVAKQLIIAAKNCGADVAKFQKRHNKSLLSDAEYNEPHPEPWHSYGKSYGLHREALEFSIEQHEDLKEFCEANALMYCSSVWDIESAKEISDLNPEIIKIPSAVNLNFEMQKYLCEYFAGGIHLSTGMTTKTELKSIIDFYKSEKRINDLVLYSCTSGYPVDANEICLLEIKLLQDLIKDTNSEVGFSGHHHGIAPDMAAITLGVSWIERHFTLNRTWKGTDHAASLEPEGLRRLCRDAKNVKAALNYKSSDILPIEIFQRKKLKKLFSGK